MSNHIKAEIVRLMREEFDPCPPNYRGYSWHDCAEEVADSIVALFASPQTDLLSRAEVLRVIRSLGEQDADLAMYGAADNARAREYGEAAATRACCAIALMPPASPSPAPAAVVCAHCDGTGDVHGIDGEWKGQCSCKAKDAL